MDFKLHSEYAPTGDQPNAIEELTNGVMAGVPYQTLLGVTGSGKTFTMANIIERTKKPTLILSHNKTLAAQLYSEFKTFFPENSVHYFVSYYDYYQPEAYIPSSDKYIEKDLQINEEIDRLRLSTVTSLLSGRRDVIVVATVSCIYGMGNPDNIKNNAIDIAVGQQIGRDEFLRQLVDALYSRNEMEPAMGNFRVKGDTVDVFLASEEIILRVIFWGNEIESIDELDKTTQLPTGRTMNQFKIFPANVFVAEKSQLPQLIEHIRVDLANQVDAFYREARPVEAKRLKERVEYDLEMIREVGYCSGIENYSRYFDGRRPGDAPFTLLDYFPKDFLVFIDESHVTVPQIRAMYNGDYARKSALVDYGFRLTSAFDNRPLKFFEFEERVGQTIYVSATPGPYELSRAENVVEQIIRPTGLLDPEVIVRPAEGQVDDLLGEVRRVAESGGRALVTTLTKRMAESLTNYLREMNVRVEYLHSDVETLERIRLLRSLRLGEYDVLVGINLLREGLDLPEVKLVAILDADKEGFLRSETSLVQTIGRAARNVDGRVIMYADTITDSMFRAISETNRRRALQQAFNEAHGIHPETVRAAVKELMSVARDVDADGGSQGMDDEEKRMAIERLEERMLAAAADLDFETAAKLRDQMLALKGEKTMATGEKSYRGRRRRR